MCDHCGCEEAGGAVAAASRTITVEQDVLAMDRVHADRLRDRLDALGARLVNLIGSPGCGKTELLAGLIPRLSPKRQCLVVEGDLATENDAERIRAVGAKAHQIQTGSGCHLTAHQVEHALEHLPLRGRSLVLVENVGNLVCPSMFYLGESLRLVCLSVTEGNDKPVKYALSYRDADLVLITKSDLAPYVDFDLELVRRELEEITPGLPSLVCSAKTGEGLDELAERLRAI